MNIRVNLNTNIADGSEVVFRSPADCSQVTGLVIYHTGGKTEFAFADAHGHNVGDIDHLFAENAVVKVILDVTAGMAFVQNADTNAYIERTFIKSVNGQVPDEKGNVEIAIPEGGNGSAGNNGKDGGYYTPTVEQIDSETIKISFEPTDADMPVVSPETISLPRGADGKKGDKGDKGDQGEQGPKGDTGATGPKGEPGEKGEKGDPGIPGVKGDPGEKGEDGINGKDGVSPTVSVSKSGKVTTITITDANGTKTATVNDGADIDTDTVPDYWKDELATKARAIREAMEDAGRNKSAFLWYTDAHWANGNSKKSPALLQYLCKHTPMNKINFGGDIVGDSLLAEDEMQYLYEWRSMIRGLPNHHSVLGNHDSFSSSDVDYENDNYRYSFLIAPEETSDMVMGDNFTYYIDNFAERTRYLYLPSGKYYFLYTDGEFAINALNTLPSGWHLVAISHIWFQYDSSSTPTTGAMNAYVQRLLDIFDDYNARRSGTLVMENNGHPQSYDFTNADGKVEFCIGGHIHTDYDIASTGGIPIILTAPDTNHDRHSGTQDCGTIGTITESAVGGIIADYSNNKVTVVGVGRMTSRVINLPATPVVTPANAKHLTIADLPKYTGGVR